MRDMLIVFESMARTNPNNAADSKFDFYNLNNTSENRGGFDCWSITRDKGLTLGKWFDADERDTAFAQVWVLSTNDTSWAQNVNDGLLHFYGDSHTVKHVTVGLSGTSVAAWRGDGTLLGVSDPGTVPPANNIWIHVEVKVVCHDTLGEVVVRVDGVEVLNLSGIDTNNGGADNLIDAVYLGSGENSFAVARGLVIWTDEPGDDFNDLLGPLLIESKVANGAGNYTDWAPDAGSNFQRVDDDPDQDGDGSYVESVLGGDRDSYTFQDITTLTEIYAVSAQAIGRFDAAPLNLGTFLRRSATDNDGAEVTPPSAAYKLLGYNIWTQDPIAAAAWTPANFDATEFGIRSVTP